LKKLKNKCNTLKKFGYSRKKENIDRKFCVMLMVKIIKDEIHPVSL